MAYFLRRVLHLYGRLDIRSIQIVLFQLSWFPWSGFVELSVNNSSIELLDEFSIRLARVLSTSRRCQRQKRLVGSE